MTEHIDTLQYGKLIIAIMIGRAKRIVIYQITALQHREANAIIHEMI